MSVDITKLVLQTLTNIRHQSICDISDTLNFSLQSVEGMVVFQKIDEVIAENLSLNGEPHASAISIHDV